jgi:membrane-associated protease RseP (regulator of RpoE activity)
MRIIYSCSVFGLAAALLSPAPAQAQSPSCDNGRGALMTDLGFRQLIRTMRTDPQTRRMELVFASEPTIRGVRPKGPAAAHLRNGDVVTAIEGRPITSREAARLYSAIRPGERVRLSVRRGGRVQDVSITASSRCVEIPPAPPAPPAPPPPPAPPAPVPPNPPGNPELLPEGRFGFIIDCNECGDDEAGAFRFGEPPVIVGVAPGSPAARAGMRAGDRLTHVNGIPLTSERGWPSFKAVQPGETVRFTFDRDGNATTTTMKALPRR